MIKIIRKEDCTGCHACAQRCPKHCIEMVSDIEGFLYPRIDTSICIECGLCELVCPVIHQEQPRIDSSKTYAAYNKNEEIRKRSSSGGIFSLLSEEILAQGGVVFGARFNDEFDVIHDFTDSIDGLQSFRGSKYVQSQISSTFLQAERYLKSGRFVLFSGTPCQIAGLKRFLRKEYSNLLAVDFVCHGVPSPKVWKAYKRKLLNNIKPAHSSNLFKPQFRSIQFRDKSRSWKRYSFAATVEVESKQIISFRELYGENVYMKGFLKDLYLRPSCYACPAKQFKSQSDITLGDYWGIQHVHPGFDDDKGVSLVFTHTDAGHHALNSIGQERLVALKSDFTSAIQYNNSICHVVGKHPSTSKFYKVMDEYNIDQTIEDMIKISVYQRVEMKLCRLLTHVRMTWPIKSLVK